MFYEGSFAFLTVWKPEPEHNISLLKQYQTIPNNNRTVITSELNKTNLMDRALTQITKLLSIKKKKYFSPKNKNAFQKITPKTNLPY
jgi:hypothetical protein